MEGKIYMSDIDNSFVYGTKEEKWEMADMLNSKDWKDACVVDRILYILLRLYRVHIMSV